MRTSWSSAPRRPRRAARPSSAPTGAPRSTSRATRSAGLRCVYHGWQYEAGGRCMDMPNERPESNFQDKVILPPIRAPSGAASCGRTWGRQALRPGCPTSSGPSCRRPSGSSRSSGRTATICRRSRAASIPRTSRSFTGSSTRATTTAARARRGRRRVRLHGAARAGAAHRGRRDGGRAAHRRAARGAGGAVLLAHHPVSAAVPHDAAGGGGERSPLPHARVDSDRRRAARELVHLVASHACHHGGRDGQFHAGSSIHVMDYAPATNEAYSDIRPGPAVPTTTSTDWEASGRGSSSACRAWARRTRPSPRASATRPLARAPRAGGPRHHSRAQGPARRGPGAARPAEYRRRARSRGLPRAAGVRVAAQGRPLGRRGERAARRSSAPAVGRLAPGS